MEEVNYHYHACYLHNAVGNSVEEEGQVKVVVVFYIHYNADKDDEGGPETKLEGFLVAICI